MNIYLDVDGVLLNHDGTLANHADEFLAAMVHSLNQAHVLGDKQAGGNRLQESLPLVRRPTAAV